MNKKIICAVFCLISVLIIFLQLAEAGSRSYPTGYNPDLIPPGNAIKARVSSLILSAQSITPPFFDNMENGTNGWAASGFWHLVSNPENIRVNDVIRTRLVQLPDSGYLPPSYSGLSCWWYGEDSTGTFIGTDFEQNQDDQSGGTSISANTGALVSPPIDLSGMSSVTLSFFTWWEIEGVDANSFDMMHVEVSTDDGVTYNTLANLNPLNDVNSAAYIAYTTNGVNRSGIWGQLFFDLSDYIGQTVRIRFRFATVDHLYNGFRGWLIDDVRVSGQSVPQLTVTSSQPSVAKVGDIVTLNGSGFIVDKSVVNIGGVDAEIVVIFHDKIYFYVPALSDGIYDILVTNSDGNSATLYNGLTISSSSPPSIISVNPVDGLNTTSTNITITGTGFINGATVQLNNTALQNVAVVNSSTITATIPAYLSGGNKNIIITNPDGMQTQCFSCFQVIDAYAPTIGNVMVNQIDTSECPIIKTYVSVTDQTGASVTGLTESNFSLTEDAILQTPLTVTNVAGSASTISVGLILDYSGSMGGQPITDMENAAQGFINQLGNNDVAEIVKFSSIVETVQGFVSDKTMLINAVTTSWSGSGGSTALYDALYQALSDSDIRTGRKALVVMTDGIDNNSTKTISEVSSAALNKGVPIFTIGLGSFDQTVLQQLATDTHGQFYSAATSSDLQAIYSAIANVIQNQYIVTYTTAQQDGAVHTVKVTVSSGGVNANDSKQFTSCINCGTALQLDQVQEDIDYGFWVDHSYKRWQEFKPTKSNLSAVDIFMYKWGEPGNLIIEIRDANYNLLGSKFLNSSQITHEEWTRVDFSTAINLIPGNTYRMFIYASQVPDETNRYFWMGSTESSYNSTVQNDVKHSWTGYDYAFRTYSNINPCIDKNPPSISLATSSTADGSYFAGSEINILINFSEAVNSSGLAITLNTGEVISTGAFNNTSWNGTYTVKAGQTTADLTITSISGIITDSSSNGTVNPTIPAGQNIGDGKAIVISLNGVCGLANGSSFASAPDTNLCSYGEVSSVTGSGPWSWTCAGQNGGSTANCSAQAASGSVEKIIYAKQEASGNYDLWMMNPDGSNKQRLTDEAKNGISSTYPSLFPNGEKILFSRGYNIAILDIASLGITDLTTEGVYGGYAYSTPHLSADGTKIAYSYGQAFSGSCDACKTWDIYIMDADGNNKTMLTNNIYRDTDPIYSPDGTRLLITHAQYKSSDCCNATDVSIVDLATKTASTLYASSVYDWGYDWGNSGIIFTIQDGRVMRINPDATGISTLLESSKQAVGAVFSPSENRILYASDINGSYDLYTADTDGSGSNAIQLTTGINVSVSRICWGFVSSSSNEIPNSITVVPLPASLNAPWTLTGPNGFSHSFSGDVVEGNLDPGEYTITWGDVAGWETPAPQTQTIAVGDSITVTGTYQLTPVIPNPPTSGTKGSNITIIGSNFGAIQGGGYVDFNGMHGTIVSWTNTQIVVTVPYGATSGCMTIVTDYGTSGCIDIIVNYNTCDPPVQISGDYYYVLQNAYDNVIDGNAILMQTGTFMENVLFDRNISTVLQGGYNCQYDTNSGYSTIDGTLIIKGGTVTVDKVIIK